MENMMRSMAQLLIDNAPVKFGLTAEDVELILTPGQAGDVDAHRRTITLRHLRTMEADDTVIGMDNAATDWVGEVDNFLTVFEIIVTCRPLAAARDKDYYTNEARALTDKVRAFFRGKGNTGLIVSRIAWEKAGTPVEGDGIVKFQRIDSEPEIDGDPTRTITITYELKWWAPAPA